MGSRIVCLRAKQREALCDTIEAMISIYSALIWTTSIIIGSFGAILFFMNEKRSSRTLVFISLSMAVWTASLGGFYYATTPENAVFFVRLGHLAGSFIAIGIYFLGYVLHSETELPSKSSRGLIALAELLFGVSYFATNIFAEKVIFTGGDPLARAILDPPTVLLHYLYIGTLIGLGIRRLGRKIREASNEHDKTHTRNIIFLIVGSGGFLASILVVTRALGYSEYYWLASFAALVWVFSFSYSLTKFGVVPMKSFLAQVGALSMAVIAFADIFIGEGLLSTVARVTIFFFFVLLSFFFIKLLSSYEHQQAHLENVNQRLQDLDLQRSKFVSIASHQLRAPITAIIGYSSMLLENSFGILPDKAKIAVSKIFRSGKNLSQTIGDFLDASTLEMGQLRFSFGELDLGPLVKEVADEMQANARTADLNLTFTPPSSPILVNADRDKIRHVIVNLIDNAIHYTREGSIAVTLLLGGGKAILEVRDTGIGMSPETQKKIFGKFARGEEAAKKSAEGVGLGLYLAHEIIKAHGGTIRAESQGLNQGSAMVVELPLLAKRS